MKKTALILILLTAAAKIFGFAREITLSYFYGASGISDAYLISLTIPNTIVSFIGIGISTCFIPMYSNIEKEAGCDSADKFINNLINFTAVICTLLVFICTLFSIPLVRLFASGFEGKTLMLASSFTRINIWAIYFTCYIYIFTGYLQIKNNYIIPAIIALPCNILIVISIILSSGYSIYYLPAGIIIAEAVQVLIILPCIIKKGYKYTRILDLKNPYLRKMLTLLIPVIIGVSINQINVLVDKTIASRIAVGGVSTLNYANRLNLFIQGIFVLPIATVLYPVISKMAVDKNIKELKKTLSNAINVVNLLVVPITVGAMIFAVPIVRLLFGRGAFESRAIILTSDSLFYYSFGMAAFGLREVISRAFYSLQDTITPMINSAIALALNIVLNIVLSKYLGIGGLALATSISAILCTSLLFISLRKKTGSMGMRSITVTFLKVLGLSAIMGVMSKKIYSILVKSMNTGSALLISIVSGTLIYLVLICFMKIDEVSIIFETFKKKSMGR